jgi:hypothetical protein
MNTLRRSPELALCLLLVIGCVAGVLIDMHEESERQSLRTGTAKSESSKGPVEEPSITAKTDDKIELKATQSLIAAVQEPVKNKTSNLPEKRVNVPEKPSIAVPVSKVPTAPEVRTKEKHRCPAVKPLRFSPDDPYVTLRWFIDSDSRKKEVLRKTGN